ncbi:hypothetical protein GCM10010532_113380 [Dactylosporangium siamense]
MAVFVGDADADAEGEVELTGATLVEVDGWAVVGPTVGRPAEPVAGRSLQALSAPPANSAAAMMPTLVRRNALRGVVVVVEELFMRWESSRISRHPSVDAASGLSELFGVNARLAIPLLTIDCICLCEKPGAIHFRQCRQDRRTVCHSQPCVTVFRVEACHGSPRE